MQDPNPTDARRLGRTCEDGSVSGLLGLVVVLGVRDVLAPLSVSFGQREMGHEMVGCGAVPVPLVARRGDHIAGADREDGPAAGLHAPFAFGHVERLADRMRMPGAAGPRVKSTDPMVTGEGPRPWPMPSIHTSLVNHSVGPLAVGLVGWTSNPISFPSRSVVRDTAGP